MPVPENTTHPIYEFPSEDSLLSSILADSNAVSKALPTPFFNQTTVERIERRLRTHPIVYFFSKGPHGKVLNLTGNPAKFNAAVLEDGMHLSSVQNAELYQSLAFQVTKGKTAYLVATMDDFRFFPKPDAQELAQIEALKEKYADKLHPLKATANDKGFHVSSFFIEDRELYRFETVLEDDGRWSESVVLLEKEMPVVWVK